MRRNISLLVSLLMLLGTTVSAKDKAVVKLGPVKFKSVANKKGNSIAATPVGDRVQISIGGTKGPSAGALTIFLSQEQVVALTKGTTLEVTSSGNDNNPNAANILFLGTKVKIRGLKSKQTGIASFSDTVASGIFKVIKYDPSTGQLKFTLNATANPYAQTVNQGLVAGEPETINKDLKVKVKAVVTITEQ